jgi:excinuclease UvrABC ATPase subunit
LRSQQPNFPAAKRSASNSLPSIHRGQTISVLDEPTTGPHPSEVQNFIAQLDGLVDRGNPVIVVKHDMGVVARAIT